MRRSPPENGNKPLLPEGDRKTVGELSKVKNEIEFIYQSITEICKLEIEANKLFLEDIKSIYMKQALLAVAVAIEAVILLIIVL